MAETNNPGEDKAWEILGRLQPTEVCRAADASWDAATERYTMRSFGMYFTVAVGTRTITSVAPGSGLLLETHGYFFRPSVLWYLAHAREINCTGRLVKPENIPGGDIFSKGSHILPLDKVAEKYGRDRKGFLARGTELGGEPAAHGDAAVRLYPLPRVPMVMLLWLEDEEFPARVDLLFDSTCSLQLPTDIIWSVAVMTVLLMG